MIEAVDLIIALSWRHSTYSTTSSLLCSTLSTASDIVHWLSSCKLIDCNSAAFESNLSYLQLGIYRMDRINTNRNGVNCSHILGAIFTTLFMVLFTVLSVTIQWQLTITYLANCIEVPTVSGILSNLACIHYITLTGNWFIDSFTSWKMYRIWQNCCFRTFLSQAPRLEVHVLQDRNIRTRPPKHCRPKHKPYHFRSHHGKTMSLSH